MFWFECQSLNRKTKTTSDFNIENKYYLFLINSKFTSWNLTNLFMNEFSSSTKSTTIAKRIAKFSNKILFQWMKSIYKTVKKRTMFYIETIDYECSSMFFYSLIFSEKFMNSQYQMILNLIAWRIFYVAIIINLTCARSFVDTYAIVIIVNESRFSEIAKTIYSFFDHIFATLNRHINRFHYSIIWRSRSQRYMHDNWQTQ